MIKTAYKSIIILLINFLPKINSFDGLRGTLYNLLGVKSGKNFKVGSNAFIFSPESLMVGDNCYIGVMTYVGSGNIKMGNNVLIGNHVSILPSNHTDREKGNFRFGRMENKGITIGNNCWLCARSIIIAGVSISDNTKVAAGTVVLKSNYDNKFLKNIFK